MRKKKKRKKKRKKESRMKKKTCTLWYKFRLKCFLTDKDLSNYSQNAPVDRCEVSFILLYFGQNLNVSEKFGKTVRYKIFWTYVQIFSSFLCEQADRRAAITTQRRQYVRFCNLLLRKHQKRNTEINCTVECRQYFWFLETTMKLNIKHVLYFEFNICTVLYDAVNIFMALWTQ
jgi:hypothetical protein